MRAYEVLQNSIILFFNQILSLISMLSYAYRMLRLSVCRQEKINKCQKTAYFRAFCEVSIIREALRKARFSCMETYLLCSLTGEKVYGRKNAVGFRLWIRCHRLWHWDCCQHRPQFKPLDIKRQTWQWNR